MWSCILPWNSVEMSHNHSHRIKTIWMHKMQTTLHIVEYFATTYENPCDNSSAQMSILSTRIFHCKRFAYTHTHTHRWTFILMLFMWPTISTENASQCTFAYVKSGKSNFMKCNHHLESVFLLFCRNAHRWTSVRVSMVSENICAIGRSNGTQSSTCGFNPFDSFKLALYGIKNSKRFFRFIPAPNLTIVNCARKVSINQVACGLTWNHTQANEITCVFCAIEDLRNRVVSFDTWNCIKTMFRQAPDWLITNVRRRRRFEISKYEHDFFSIWFGTRFDNKILV